MRRFVNILDLVHEEALRFVGRNDGQKPNSMTECDAIKQDLS